MTLFDAVCKTVPEKEEKWRPLSAPHARGSCSRRGNGRLLPSTFTTVQTRRSPLGSSASAENLPRGPRVVSFEKSTACARWREGLGATSKVRPASAGEERRLCGERFHTLDDSARCRRGRRRFPRGGGRRAGDEAEEEIFECLRHRLAEVIQGGRRGGNCKGFAEEGRR